MSDTIQVTAHMTFYSRCLVCNEPMTQADFDAALVAIRLGPEFHFAAHMRHFRAQDGNRTPDARRNAETFGKRSLDLEDPS